MVARTPVHAEGIVSSVDNGHSHPASKQPDDKMCNRLSSIEDRYLYLPADDSAYRNQSERNAIILFTAGFFYF